MAQPFSLRYMLVDGQGNFGSIDGDSAGGHALHRDSHGENRPLELLADLDKETVDYVPNYDEHRAPFPDVLPTRVPNLLVNGSRPVLP